MLRTQHVARYETKINFVNIVGNAFTEIPHTELHIIKADK
jgi:hypothetical protein